MSVKELSRLYVSLIDYNRDKQTWIQIKDDRLSRIRDNRLSWIRGKKKLGLRGVREGNKIFLKIVPCEIFNGTQNSN